MLGVLIRAGASVTAFDAGLRESERERQRERDRERQRETERGRQR